MTAIIPSNAKCKTGYEYSILGAFCPAEASKTTVLVSVYATLALECFSATSRFLPEGAVTPWLVMGATALASNCYWGDKNFLECWREGVNLVASPWKWNWTLEPKEGALRELSAKVSRFTSESGITLKVEKESSNEKTNEVESSTEAKKATDEKLKLVTQHVKFYLTFLYLSTNVLPFFSNNEMDKEGFHKELMDLATRAEKERENGIDPIDLYIAHFRQKNKTNPYNPLSVICEWGARFRYFCVHRLIDAKTRIAFKAILKEIRESTDGRIQNIFEEILGHMNEFLTRYNDTKGRSFSTKESKNNFSVLCKKISPLLVQAFYPKDVVAEKAAKIPVFGSFLDLPTQGLDYCLNQFGQAALRYYLPDVLQSLSDSVLNQTKADSLNQQNLMNFSFAIPLAKTVNTKLKQFSQLLDESNSQIEQPLSAGAKEKLIGVVTQIMIMADVPEKDVAVAKGIQDGLVRGGDALKQYWKEQPEVMLLELVSLANIAFEKSDLPETESGCLVEYRSLKKEQNSLVDGICDKIFGQQVRKFAIGTPEEATRTHLAESDRELKETFQKGLKERALLRDSLVKAEETLDFHEYLQSLNKHMIYWDEFAQKLTATTAEHNPKVARDILLRNFSPICEVGTKQISIMNTLQNTWISYKRLDEVEKSILCLENDLSKSDDFQKIVTKMRDIPVFDSKRSKALKDLLININEIETLRGTCKKMVEFSDFFEGFTPQADKVGQIDAILERKLVEDPLILQKVQELRRLSLSKSVEAKDVRLNIIKSVSKLISDRNSTIKGKQDSLFGSMNLASPDAELGSKALISKCCSWMKIVIKDSKKQSLTQLKKGREEIEALEFIAKKHVDGIRPTSLGFPLEHTFLTNPLTRAGELLRGKSKEDLKGSFLKILDNVGGLLTTKTRCNEGNLYSWVENVAFSEIIKYLQNKNGI